jgi:hypothetical protein
MKFKAVDLAEFEFDDAVVKYGEAKCLLCNWKRRIVEAFAFPFTDELIESHVKEAHPERVNDAGIQKAPKGNGLVYFALIDAAG